MTSSLHGLVLEILHLQGFDHFIDFFSYHHSTEPIVVDSFPECVLCSYFFCEKIFPLTRALCIPLKIASSELQLKSIILHLEISKVTEEAFTI